MEEALCLYRAAAGGGYVYSMYALGTCCERGIGMDADLEQAVIWFEQAASGGMAKSHVLAGASLRIWYGHRA